MTAALIAHRNTAFEQIGTDVSGYTNATDVLEAAGMTGWNVRTTRMFFGAGQPVPNRYAVVRDLPNTDTLGYLGQVGGVYKPFQNEATAEVLNFIADEGGMRFGRAGFIDGGARTFVTMAMPTSLLIETQEGGQDRTDWNLVAFNSHDGSSSLKFAVTGIRPACANQQDAVIAGAESWFSIRHTTHAKFVIEQIRRGLKLSFRFAEAFEQEAAAMYASQMAVDEAERFVRDLFEVHKADTREKRTNLIMKGNEVLRLFETSETITSIAGTRWAAYNAVTEWADHKQATKGPRHTHADKRALRTLSSPATHKIKARAFALLTKV